MITKLNIRHIFIALAFVLCFAGCKPEQIEIVFEDQKDLSVFGYLKENEAEFSSFIKIITAGELENALSSYNPYGDGYTLFLPDNSAIDHFIEADPRFSSLENILEDLEFCKIFSRYHVVNMSVNSNDFPFGAFSKQTLSGDYLTVSFYIETDSSYYKINNSATVIKPNIEVSNGYIHQIHSALSPVTYTSYEWLNQNPEFSIFLEAINLTGLANQIDLNLKELENVEAVTVLAEPDSIFHKNRINSIEELIQVISPDDVDYTNDSNPLNQFVAYHFLKGNFFIDDFIDVNSVYSTFAGIPVNINGLGLDILINQGKQVFDTIISNSDTTYIDYVKFIYDESNLISQSGAVHFVDQIMNKFTPPRTTRTFQFFEEPALYEFRDEGGSFLLENADLYNRLSWSGADMFFISEGDPSPAWNGDYLETKGDFFLSYKVPEIIPGIYNVLIRADAFNNENALIEVFIDGKKIGGLIDLSIGGSASNPFKNIELGVIDLKNYSEHVVEIRPLIPGRFLWDFVRFEPV